jgi:hypothetical protein
VAVISDPARMKERSCKQACPGKNKGMLFDFKKEQKGYYEHEKYELFGYDIYKHKKQRGCGCAFFDAGNFETAVEILLVLEVNKMKVQG